MFPTLHPSGRHRCCAIRRGINYSPRTPGAFGLVVGRRVRRRSVDMLSTGLFIGANNILMGFLSSYVRPIFCAADVRHITDQLSLADHGRSPRHGERPSWLCRPLAMFISRRWM
jgi:hypothetical protein